MIDEMEQESWKVKERTLYMATYKEIQQYVKQKYGYIPKTCWIAHMKEVCGIPVKVAPNRSDVNKRKKPCPEEKQDAIRDAFIHFNML